MKKVVSIFILFAIVLPLGVGLAGRAEASTGITTSKVKVVAKKVAKKVTNKKVVKKKKKTHAAEPILPAPLLAPDPAYYQKK